MRANIYEVSHLYDQPAPRWEAMLAELEKEEKVRFLAYKPLRQAIILEMKSPGAGRPHLDRSFAKTAVNKTEEAVRAKSYTALRTFIGAVRPKLGELVENFMMPNQPSCHWEGHDLTGGFHFSVLTKKGETAYVYLSASAYSEGRARDVQQRKAIIELLNIIAENRFSAEPSQVWFVDLNTGKTHKPGKSVLRLRRELKGTLDHLQRIKKQAA